MAKERKVAPVTDNMDKRNTYATHMARYRKAVQNEFYLEAMMITYAVLEDRLRSFLYYIGVIASNGSLKVNRKVRASLLLTMNDKKDTKETKLSIKNITGKIFIVRSTMLFAMRTNEIPYDDTYLKMLKSVYEGAFDVSDALNTLDQIDQWKEYRNELVHALMNKNLDSLNNNLAQRCSEGMALARAIDGYVKKLRRKNEVRVHLRLGK